MIEAINQIHILILTGYSFIFISKNENLTQISFNHTHPPLFFGKPSFDLQKSPKTTKKKSATTPISHSRNIALSFVQHGIAFQQQQKKRPKNAQKYSKLYLPYILRSRGLSLGLLKKNYARLYGMGHIRQAFHRIWPDRPSRLFCL